jgi:hypothetical protein
LIVEMISGSSPATGRSGANVRFTLMRRPVRATSNQESRTTARKAKASRKSSQVPTSRAAK